MVNIGIVCVFFNCCSFRK